MTSRVLYSAQYHRLHCTLHAFEQFGALYMHNHDDKYPSRPEFEPGTPRLQAPVDTNEPSSLSPGVMWEQRPTPLRDRLGLRILTSGRRPSGLVSTSFCCQTEHAPLSLQAPRWTDALSRLRSPSRMA